MATNEQTNNITQRNMTTYGEQRRVPDGAPCHPIIATPTERTLEQTLTWGAIKANWSMSCSEPLPLSRSLRAKKNQQNPKRGEERN
jgi:hypothetical protein